jgi:hypothetical protein
MRSARMPSGHAHRGPERLTELPICDNCVPPNQPDVLERSTAGSAKTASVQRVVHALDELSDIYLALCVLECWAGADWQAAEHSDRYLWTVPV